jgi:hypothetical protein
MNFERALTYPLRGSDWFLKLLIGALLNLIPVVGSILTYGYSLRATRRVMQGDDESLPAWDDWGGDFVRGFLLFVGWFIYYLPAMPLFCCLVLVSAATTNDNGEMNAGGTLMTLCLYGLILAYSLVTLPFLAAAAARYAQSDQFGEAFLNFGQRFQEVRNNAMPTFFLMMYGILTIIIIGVITGLTFWICGLGLLVAFAGNLILAHFLAQYGLTLAGDHYKVKNSDL